MRSDPFNKKLHKYLLSKKYKYTEHTRYDRYDLNQVTIFYYASGYIMILDGDAPASREITKEIEEVL